MSVQLHVDSIFERPAECGVSLAIVVLHRGEVAPSCTSARRPPLGATTSWKESEC